MKKISVKVAGSEESVTLIKFLTARNERIAFQNKSRGQETDVSIYQMRKNKLDNVFSRISTKKELDTTCLTLVHDRTRGTTKFEVNSSTVLHLLQACPSVPLRTSNNPLCREGNIQPGETSPQGMTRERNVRMEFCELSLPL